VRFSSFLQHTRTLRAFDLSGNQVDDEGGYLVLQALHFQDSVTHVLFERNRLERQAAEMALKAADRKTQLVVFRLGDNNIPERRLRQIESVLRRNKLEFDRAKVRQMEGELRALRDQMRRFREVSAEIGKAYLMMQGLARSLDNAADGLTHFQDEQQRLIERDEQGLAEERLRLSKLESEKVLLAHQFANRRSALERRVRDLEAQIERQKTVLHTQEVNLDMKRKELQEERVEVLEERLAREHAELAAARGRVSVAIGESAAFLSQLCRRAAEEAATRERQAPCP
jgi:hypothetical protein